MKKVLAVHRQNEIPGKIKELAPSDWDVRVMTNSIDAMLSARMEHYDLIFCCLNLPMVTGIELIRSIRSLSVNKHTPVFILAEGSETEDQRGLAKRLRTTWLWPEDVAAIVHLAG